MNRRESIYQTGVLLTILYTLFVVFSFAACVDDEISDDSSTVLRIRSKGIITASLNRYVKNSADDEPFEQFGLTGVFARFPEKEQSTVDMLWDTPLADVDLGLDRCTAVSPVLDNRVRPHFPSSQRSIELLDIGDLSISLNGKSRPIPTRTFPDLLKAIVGVIYAADETQGVRFLPGETYSVRANDVEDKKLFEATLQAPEDLGVVKVDGISPGDETPILSKNRPIQLTWDGDGFGDEVIATISWTSMGSPWAVTCRMRDDGQFTIPAYITSSLPDPLTSSDEGVSVHRVRQVVFRSELLSSISFRFIVSTHFPIKF